ALTLEGVSGQRDSPWTWLAVQCSPIDGDTRQPKLRQSGQQNRHVRQRLVRVAYRVENGSGGGFCWMLTHQRCQRLSRANFEEKRVLALQKARDSVTESYRTSHVPGPVNWVGGLGGGNPVAGQVGDEGNRG